MFGMTLLPLFIQKPMHQNKWDKSPSNKNSCKKLKAFNAIVSSSLISDKVQYVKAKKH
jgi:hypothetical protein